MSVHADRPILAGWAAGTYQVAFQAAQRGNNGTSAEDFQVLLDGAVVGTFKPTGTSYQQYATASFAVAAGSHTIAFHGLNSAGGDNSVLLDQVLVVTPADSRVSYAAYYYDAADRLTASVDVGTNGGAAYARPAVPPARSDTALVTGYQYDFAGWVNLVTDPRGIMAEADHDMLGRTTRSVAAYAFSGPPPSGTTPTTSTNQTTQYTYDGLGHALTVTAVMPTGTPSQTTTYAYGVTTAGGSAVNSNDLLASVTQPGTPAQAVTYAYDALGDVVTRTDPNNTAHAYTYDVLGRQVGDAATHLGAGVDGAVLRLATAYDSQGNAYLFTSFDAASGGNVVNQVENVFNGLGQLAGEYQEHGGAVNTATTPEVRYAYTEMAGGQDNSRLIGMTYPNGRVLDYLYNSGLDGSLGRVSAIVDDSTGTTLESYLYLGLGSIVEQDHPQPGVNLSYIRQPAQANANSDGGDQYVGLDRFGRVVDQTWVKASTGTPVVRYQYGYDRAGDALYRADLVDAALSELYHASSSAAGDSNSAYDPLGRLTGFARGTLSASGRNGATPDTLASPSATQAWQLDALGNWSGLTTNGSTTARGFDARNQTTSVGGGTAPTYDAAGNTVTDSGQAFVYDAWNRLVAVKLASTGATLAAYGYDALGRRVTEAYSGTVNHLYFSADGHVVEERQGGTAAANLADQYVRGIAGNLVLRDDAYSGGAPTRRLYALADANGDVTALVDATGTVVRRYAYSPYGAVTVLDASGAPTSGGGYGWRYLFQGGRLDTASGNYLFGARDYNPAEGRWTERDPLGLAAGDANEYRFVGNDPIGQTDPSGLSTGYYRFWESLFLLGYPTSSPPIQQPGFEIGQAGRGGFDQNAIGGIIQAGGFRAPGGGPLVPAGAATEQAEAAIKKMVYDVGTGLATDAAAGGIMKGALPLVGALGSKGQKLGKLGKKLDHCPAPNTKAPLRYKLGPNDADWRGTGKTVDDALSDAFSKTGQPRSVFEVTKWGKDKYGKSSPVEWRHPSGAEVNIDLPHVKNGPDAPHVGWQTGGKRGGGGAQRGHTILDDVPNNR